MEQIIHSRIKAFIMQQAGVAAEEVTPDASLLHDFGMYGDDAVDFFNAFSKTFHVDISNFRLSDYFDGEGGRDLMDVIFQLLPGKNQGNYRNRKKNITVAHLVTAAEAGVLDEELINRNTLK